MSTKPSKLTEAILNALVLDEATKLKENITTDERSYLSFRTLLTSDSTRCVYGQITGSCWSKRAVELIEASCQKVLAPIKGGEGIRGTLNGSPKESNRWNYWSPIEVFIDKPRNQENGNNERLIAFLKDETKTLKLK